MKIRMCSALVLSCLSALASAVDVNGELEWANRVTLSVPVSGIVATVAVRPGEAVAAGQSLLSLDAREVQARVAHANSAVKKLELHRAEAEREWERAQELFDRTVLSERELQLAEIGIQYGRIHVPSSSRRRIVTTAAVASVPRLPPALCAIAIRAPPT